MAIWRLTITTSVMAVTVAIQACGGGGAPLGANGTAASLSRHDSLPAVDALAGLRGDEDDDETHLDGVAVAGWDNDSDGDDDRSNAQQKGYYDADDGVVRRFGRAAYGAEERAVAAVVRRYGAATSRNDGMTACGLLKSSFARALAVEYGGGLGPRYLRDAHTCSAVMDGMTSHDVGLKRPLEIVAVRLRRGVALVLVGSPSRAAGYFFLEREAGEWRLVSIQPSVLP